MKRSFEFDTTTLSTVPPLLESGVYEGTVCNAAIVGKENKRYINVVPETVWDKNQKAFVPTGEHIVEGNIFFGAILTDKRAIETLQQDEPRVFGGRIRLMFNKDNYKLASNYVLGSWLKALQLDQINFSNDVDFEYDEDIYVPEDLAGVTDIVAKLNSVEYHSTLFNTMCQAANSTKVRVMVTKQPSYRNKEILENMIDTGNYNSSCGILETLEM